MRPISSGTNEYHRSHPLFAHFAKLAGKEEKIYKHAEFSALLNAGRKDVYAILVQRFNRNGEMLLAKPCVICQNIIKSWGVKKVMYTTPTGIDFYMVS